MRLHFLKEYQKAEYTILWLNNKLMQHLIDIDKSANERLNSLIKQLAEKENVTEKLKENNQMEWVGKMNNIKHCAEELVLNELIYV